MSPPVAHADCNIICSFMSLESLTQERNLSSSFFLFVCFFTSYGATFLCVRSLRRAKFKSSHVTTKQRCVWVTNPVAIQKGAVRNHSYSCRVAHSLSAVSLLGSRDHSSVLHGSGGVVNSLNFCPASLKSLGCF